MSDVFRRRKQRKRCFVMGNTLDKSLLIFQEENIPDPHVWFDTNLWILEAEAVAAKLSDIDPENKDYYMSNLESYKKELSDLTEYVIRRINEASPNRAKEF